MKIKQTILTYVAILVFSCVIFLPIVAVSTEAKECAGVDTSIIDCEDQGGDNGDIENTGIWSILMMVINILTAGIGIVAVGSIVYGAILYSSASGNAEQVKRARTIIINVVVGLVAYALTYAFLQWLIPGGVFE